LKIPALTYGILFLWKTESLLGFLLSMPLSFFFVGGGSLFECRPERIQGAERDKGSL